MGDRLLLFDARALPGHVGFNTLLHIQPVEAVSCQTQDSFCPQVAHIATEVFQDHGSVLGRQDELTSVTGFPVQKTVPEEQFSSLFQQSLCQATFSSSHVNGQCVAILFQPDDLTDGWIISLRLHVCHGLWSGEALATVSLGSVTG